MNQRITKILAGSALVVSIASTTPASAAEPWVGGAYGRDFLNFDPMGVVSFEAGMWPKDKKFGFQGYVEYANPSCDGEMWTVGIEPIWRYKKFYAGLGLALSEKRLCNLQGTNWTFSIPVGFRINEHVDIQWRHRSHGSDFGIQSNSPNDGVNLIEVRIYTRIGSRK